MQWHLPLIRATVNAAQDATQQESLDTVLRDYSDPALSKLVDTVRRIVSGERDPEALGLDSDLDLASSMIVGIILAALSDPSTLSDLLPPDHDPDSE